MPIKIIMSFLLNITLKGAELQTVHLIHKEFGREEHTWNSGLTSLLIFVCFEQIPYPPSPDGYFPPEEFE